MLISDDELDRAKRRASCARHPGSTVTLDYTRVSTDEHGFVGYIVTGYDCTGCREEVETADRRSVRPRPVAATESPVYDRLAMLPLELQPIASCETCGKMSYLSRSVARRVIKRGYQDRKLAPYRCGQYWHVGHSRRKR